MTTDATDATNPAWRDDLSDEQQRKIAPELAQWLDGEGEPQTHAIWARRLEELAPDQVDEFIALGLQAEEDMLVIPGTVTREQLLDIVRHPDIIAVNPVGRSEPTGPTGPTGSSNPTEQRGPTS